MNRIANDAQKEGHGFNREVKNAVLSILIVWHP